MRFNSELDAKTFLVEIKEFSKLNEVTQDYQPTKEELKLFLKSRSPLVKSVKNQRKSSTQKANWRKNRHKMLKGIKAFHKSVDGKRFHRRLGRFLATRITRVKRIKPASEMLISKKEWLKGLNAAKQHLLVELEYFHQLQEQVELEEFVVEYAYPFFRSIESKILTEEELTGDEVVFLFDLIENKAIINSFSDKTDKTPEEVKVIWTEIEKELGVEGFDIESDDFYPLLVTRLKKTLGIK